MSNKRRKYSMRERQVSVSRETYAALASGLPRNANGRIRPGEMRRRADALIKAALDREERQS